MSIPENRGQENFSENWKGLMAIEPFGIIWRWYEYLKREFLFIIIWKQYTGFFNKLMGNLFQKNLEGTIFNKELRRKLTPNFKLGCKRVLFADEYFSCMNSGNFVLETDEINCLHVNGIKTENAFHEVDIIIYATGFKLLQSNIKMKVIIHRRNYRG